MIHDETASATIDPTPRVQVREVVPRDEKELQHVRKLIVAVHGVGDQSSFATLQGVIKQFCQFRHRPAGLPLGEFHDGFTPFVFPDNAYSDLHASFKDLAFAEVYWAPIPRDIVKDQHTLEEAKAWARTIIERLRMKWRMNRENDDDPDGYQDSDFSRSKQILSEMIETVGVVDRLCLLAEKAGLFRFDLRRILDDYLGDVQIVAEFGSERRKILDAFDDTLEKAARNCPTNTEIYIVAHSEGTVVTLLGLLEAFRRREVPSWAKQVRGVITLGSPIDKHLHLWPWLFEGRKDADAPREVPDKRIKWCNYYDNGDPIGFELDDLRAWFETQAGGAWTTVFDFTDDDDHGFTRYVLPGKAHVDYWRDDDLFRHFITTVVKLEVPPPTGQTAVAAATATGKPPQTKRWAEWISRYVPYVGVFALLWIAAFVLYRATMDAMFPWGDGPHNRDIVRYVTALSFVMAGVSIAGRVPRLTRKPLLRWGSFGAAVGCTVIYALLWNGLENPLDAGWLAKLTIALGAAIVVLVNVVGRRYPQWGAKPMIISGAVAVSVLIGKLLWTNEDHGPLWPIVVATLGFLYLWWLASLLFDLVVVWHAYIRNSEVNNRIRDLTRHGTRADADIPVSLRASRAISNSSQP